MTICSVRKLWSTPDGDERIAYIARISAPPEMRDRPAARLIRHLADNGHWSPLDMANLCVEVDTTREISRQILRHWSIRPQEYSGRWAEHEPLIRQRDVRMRDPSNRAKSLPCEDDDLRAWWEAGVRDIAEQTERFYRKALAKGVARECARVVLPEGLTPTRLDLNGTVRSWVHYLAGRRAWDAQPEHRDVADALAAIFEAEFPMVAAALTQEAA